MAKSLSKPVSQKAKPAKTTAKPKAVTIDIEKASEEALAGLKLLNIEHQLQADLEWCLGSYRADKNPIGLIDVTRLALSIFKTEQKKKTRGVTTKLISDLEKALKAY